MRILTAVRSTTIRAKALVAPSAVLRRVRRTSCLPAMAPAVLMVTETYPTVAGTDAGRGCQESAAIGSVTTAARRAGRTSEQVSAGGREGRRAPPEQRERCGTHAA